MKKIGITGSSSIKGYNELISVQGAYVKSVIRAGHIPIIIPITDDDNLIDSYLDEVDGVVLTGGGDIHSKFYSEQPIRELGPINEERDLFDKKVIEKCLEKNIKMLGICRGCQFINILLGGTLYQDIYKQKGDVCGHNPDYFTIRRDILYHDINIKEDTLLYKLVGKNKLGVNSFHHQAIKDIADKLEVCAISEDDVIEAAESKDGNILCIQWHPEELSAKYDENLNIFKQFFNN